MPSVFHIPQSVRIDCMGDDVKKNDRLFRAYIVLAAAYILLLCAFLSGCTRVIGDCSDELVMHSWAAEYDNGTSISLSFDEDRAVLTAKAGETKHTLSGICILSLTDFTICDEKTRENYTFSYTVHGDSLELTYDGSTLILINKQ